MKLHSISLTNFLCYYGSNNKLTFDDGLNLILGANGYGKSKLYDAFQWVFKDGITDDSAPGRIKNTSFLKKELISEKALMECEVGENVFCEVVIEVSDSSSTYQLKRKYFASKKDATTWVEAKTSSFEVYKKDVIHFKPLDEDSALSIPNRLIGDEVMPYVWFQGEKGVNSIIDTSSKDALKRVIEKLSDIEKWDEYSAIMQKAATTAGNDFNKELKNNNRNQQEYDSLVVQQSSLKGKLEKSKEELNNAVLNHEAANNKFNSILGKLDSAQKITDLDKRRKQKASDLEATINGIESFQLTFTKRLFSDYWLLMGTEKLVSNFEEKYKVYNDFVSQRKVAEAIAKANTNSQTRLPRGIPERMHLQRMLDQQLCLVCNRPAKQGTPEYKAIQDLLPELTKVIDTKPDIESDLRRLWNSSFSMSDKFGNAEAEIAEAIKDRDKLLLKKSELEEEIKKLDADINNEILNSGIDRATDIVSMAEVTNQDIQNYSKAKGRLEVEQETIEKDLKGVDTRLKQLSVGNIDPIFLRKKELLDDLVELTARVKEKQYKGLVQQLEKAANFHYENINKPTGAFYGKIKFVETSVGGYLPENFDDNGQRVSNPNTSQTSSLKLSIILAIMSANQDRGYNNRYPLIADAPISDFDPLKKKSFLIETAKTFHQSIVIIYDFLESDSERTNRFKPEIEKIKELQNAIEKSGKKFTVHYLDIPDGISTTNRSELSVKIRPLNLI
jgi:DNA sulfur modification protein DndD